MYIGSNHETVFPVTGPGETVLSEGTVMGAVQQTRGLPVSLTSQHADTSYSWAATRSRNTYTYRLPRSLWRCNGPDLTEPQHCGGYKPGWCLQVQVQDAIVGGSIKKICWIVVNGENINISVMLMMQCFWPITTKKKKRKYTNIDWCQLRHSLRSEHYAAQHI